MWCKNMLFSYWTIFVCICAIIDTFVFHFKTEHSGIVVGDALLLLIYQPGVGITVKVAGFRS